MAKAIKAGKIQGKNPILPEEFMDSFEDFTPWEFEEFGVHSEDQLSKLVNELTSLEVMERFGVNTSDTWDF